MHLRIRVITLVWLLSAFASNSGWSDDEKENKINWPVELKEFTLKVNDSQGRPVEGVEMRAYALRCEEDAGSHYGWPTYNTGPAPLSKTNAEGEVVLKYPTKFGQPPNWKTTSQISMSLRHPEYVGTEVHLDPRGGGDTTVIKAGCELTFSANDYLGQPITQFAIMMAGPGRGAKWQTKDTIKRSRAIPDGKWQTMLVQSKDDGIHLFSGILPVRLADEQAVSIRNVVLKPGVRFIGKLEDSVPRPIANGQVLAWCLPKPAGNAWGNDDPSLTWCDIANVDADGTFTFKSLPRSGLIQLIAICDGWVSQNHPDYGNEATGWVYELDKLEGDNVKEVEVLMKKTGQAKVTVKDADGNPIPRVIVGTYPNQRLLKSGSQILGSGYPSLDEVEYQLSDGEKNLQKKRREEKNKEDPDLPYIGGANGKNFLQRTDANGVAVLRGIPLNEPENIGFSHDDYILEPDNGREEISFQCKTTDPVELSVTLIPRPKEK